MEAINRSAIAVKPAQPFLDWLHRVDPTSAQLTLDDLSLEPTIYLLPECQGKEEAIEGSVATLKEQAQKGSVRHCITSQFGTALR